MYIVLFYFNPSNEKEVFILVAFSRIIRIVIACQYITNYLPIENDVLKQIVNVILTMVQIIYIASGVFTVIEN